jgi:hypothetical protein
MASVLEMALRVHERLKAERDERTRGDTGKECDREESEESEESPGTVTNGPKQPSERKPVCEESEESEESPWTFVNGRWYAPGYEDLRTPFDEESVP